MDTDYTKVVVVLFFLLLSFISRYFPFSQRGAHITEKERGNRIRKKERKETTDNNQPPYTLRICFLLMKTIVLNE